MYASLTVAIQFLSLAVLVFTGPVLPRQPLPLLLVMGGVILGTWALWVMRKSVFRVSPDVSPKARLVTDGPYAVIRHPMYAAVLMTSLGWLISDQTYLRLAVYLVLCADMLWKVTYEERALTKHFPSYAAYRKKTSRIIPYLY